MREYKRNLQEASTSGLMDMYFVYRFAKYVGMAWTSWDAFKEGVIDENGKLLLKSGQRKTVEQKDSYTYFHRLVRKVKFYLEKVPGMKSKLGKAVAAYFLFKEEVCKHGANGKMLDKTFVRHVQKTMDLNESVQIELLMKQREELNEQRNR